MARASCTWATIDMAKKPPAEIVVFSNPQPIRPTLDSMLVALEEHRVQALNEGQIAAANQALALQAKLLGLITTKLHVEHTGDFTSCRSVEEIYSEFAELYGEDEARYVTRTVQRKISRK